MNTDDLPRCPICGKIPVKEQKDFLEKLSFSTKFFRKEECIARQGDTVNALYILERGSVKTEMIADSGTVLNIETISAPNLLAPAFLFAENNRFPVDVTALEDCEIMIVAKASIMKQLAENAAFLQAFITFNANRTHFLSERLKFISIKTIKGKLAHYILSKAQNADFTMTMNQSDLAEYFGVARPSLSRSLSEMVHEEIISLKGKQGKILNPAKLKELVLQ